MTPSILSLVRGARGDDWSQGRRVRRSRAERWLRDDGWRAGVMACHGAYAMAGRLGQAADRPGLGCRRQRWRERDRIRGARLPVWHQAHLLDAGGIRNSAAGARTDGPRQRGVRHGGHRDDGHVRRELAQERRQRTPLQPTGLALRGCPGRAEGAARADLTAKGVRVGTCHCRSAGHGPDMCSRVHDLQSQVAGHGRGRRHDLEGVGGLRVLDRGGPLFLEHVATERRGGDDGLSGLLEAGRTGRRRERRETEDHENRPPETMRAHGVLRFRHRPCPYRMSQVQAENRDSAHFEPEV